MTPRGCDVLTAAFEPRIGSAVLGRIASAQSPERVPGPSPDAPRVGIRRHQLHDSHHQRQRVGGPGGRALHDQRSCARRGEDDHAPTAPWNASRRHRDADRHARDPHDRPSRSARPDPRCSRQIVAGRWRVCGGTGPYLRLAGNGRWQAVTELGAAPAGMTAPTTRGAFLGRVSRGPRLGRQQADSTEAPPC
jgi:hypothetical protein